VSRERADWYVVLKMNWNVARSKSLGVDHKIHEAWILHIPCFRVLGPVSSHEGGILVEGYIYGCQGLMGCYRSVLDDEAQADSSLMRS
jgi:hypothetical protein